MNNLTAREKGFMYVITLLIIVVLGYFFGIRTLNNKYDIVFIDAAKSKYSIFLEESLKLLNNNGLILADNVLYKGYVMSDYNKHKQRTAVRHLREYIKEITENPDFETEILDIGDGLAITKVHSSNA